MSLINRKTFGYSLLCEYLISISSLYHNVFNTYPVPIVPIENRNLTLQTNTYQSTQKKIMLFGASVTLSFCS